MGGKLCIIIKESLMSIVLRSYHRRIARSEAYKIMSRNYGRKIVHHH
jgi:hypothetical protein